MRLIIEIDTQADLEQVAALLGSEVLKDKPIEVRRPPTRAERQAILLEIFGKYRAKLPKGWKFDRDQAHER